MMNVARFLLEFLHFVEVLELSYHYEWKFLR